ncbi:hypothetical protein [Clostridium sp. HV4-5-A1G]|jgi:hypothetical protein|uniref:hypothetical protein n=1 Tax=Clostridium sp. HV4-5-A1G TaxID=2004595 RepID=UPI001687C86A|nr:hypothetical protein [Clostridium sp. HV4-5-A1G]
MKIKYKKNSRKFSASVVFYAVSLVIALIGIALLVNNILFFRSTVNNYVAQGYSYADVVKQLIPSQLLPGIFEPIAVYGGIAIVLLGVGIVNKKISKCLTLLKGSTVEENTAEQNADHLENTKTTEQIEFAEEINVNKA